MTASDDVIRMAREAGLAIETPLEHISRCARFAELVAAAERVALAASGPAPSEALLDAAYDAAEATGQCMHDLKFDAIAAIVKVAVAAEREACAKVADDVAGRCLHPDEIAEHIRARGTPQTDL